MDDAKTFPTGMLEALRAQVKGAVLEPGEAAYDEARALWNAMIDRQPAAILRCAGPEDVSAALKAAAEFGVPLSVKAGGHNISGSALVEGGLTLDLSGMRDVVVDPEASCVSVGAGALLGDVDAATVRHGLAVPTGINSTTGIAGLTLGGGYGWLTRKMGLTIDSLAAVEIATPAGEQLRASDAENSDLFWAVRGGGGNFGVVTRFHFNLHPLPHDVTAGLIIHSAENSTEILQKLRDLAPTLPEELTVWAVLRKAPPLPFLDAAYNGARVVVLACCWCGAPEDADKALEPVRAIGTPLAEAIGPQPLSAWQTAFDPLNSHGARNYWKSHMFDEVNDDLIDVFAEALERLPGDECEIFVAQLGGAPTRVDASVTAYPHRAAAFMMNMHARWQDAAEDDRYIAWAREFFDRTEPHANGGVYSNFMPEDETDRATGAFGAAYARLADIKARHDPAGLMWTQANVVASA